MMVAPHPYYSRWMYSDFFFQRFHINLIMDGIQALFQLQALAILFNHVGKMLVLRYLIIKLCIFAAQFFKGVALGAGHFPMQVALYLVQIFIIAHLFSFFKPAEKIIS